MKRVSLALGVFTLAAAVGIGCGGGEPTTSDTSTTQTPAPQTPPAGNVEVTLTTQPDPPQMGETTFEAMVMMGGQPVTDAEVAVELYMPAMPQMKMAEMRNSFPLKHEGGGRYRGAGNVMMAGSWDATVSVKRDGQEVGARKIPIAAR